MSFFGRLLPMLLTGGLLGLVPAVSAAEPPVFVGDVAPLLAAHCVECHYDGGIGPFPLVTYRDAQRRARQMAEVTATRYMPPWKPDAVHTPKMMGERRLTEQAIATLQAWYEAGAPPGNLDAFTPPPLPEDEWQLGQPDIVLEFPEPYDVPAEGMDIFRNFVLPLPIDRPRYVRAVQFLPESNLIVHHGIIAFDPTNESRELDAADPGPGFESMDTGGGISPNGHIIGWTPGQAPYEVHPGTAFTVVPGTDLILQLHLLPSGRPEKLAPRVGLYFTDEPPTRTGYTLLLREDEIDLPAGAKGVTVEEAITLPAPADVLGLYPHAHYLGNDMRLFAELPDGSRQWLLHIPDWDFNWQTDYRYEAPLPLPAGARIVMRYSYDNSADNPRNPRHPPVDVEAGNSSFDEMGSAAIQLLLRDESDLPRFVETQARYEIDSGNRSADAFYNLAVAISEQGRTADAITAYQDTLAVDPDHPYALNNLASIRERSGDLAGARELYRRALAANPASTDIRLNLARLHEHTGRTDAGIDVLREGVHLAPGDFVPRSVLASVLQRAGRPAEALATLEAGLELHGRDPRLRLQLANTLLQQERPADARKHLESALTLPPPASVGADPAIAAALRVEVRLALVRLHMVTGNQHAAVDQLMLLLSAPPTASPPDDDALLRRLPYPDALPLLAQAWVDLAAPDRARALLERHADHARSQQDNALAEALLRLRDQI